MQYETGPKREDRRVLLVDDDIEFTSLLQRRLHDANYASAVVADGASALDAALQRKPRAVLLDLGLPDEDGFEVLKRLRSHPRVRHVPVIVLTSDSEAAHRERASRLGAFAFVNKWATSWELLRVVERACGDDRARGVAL